jgi:hypothetical protein
VQKSAKINCVSSGEGNVGCAKARSTDGKLARLKRLVLSVEYSLIRPSIITVGKCLRYFSALYSLLCQNFPVSIVPTIYGWLCEPETRLPTTE